MKTTHAGAGITKAAWDRSLKIFGEVLNKFEVPEKERQESAALLLPLEKDVVDKQQPLRSASALFLVVTLSIFGEHDLPENRHPLFRIML